MKKKIYLIFVAVCFILCSTCFLLFYHIQHRPSQIQKTAEEVAKRGGGHTDRYRRLVDFNALKELNEDIYAWLYIPGTEINCPVLQSRTGDQDYYLTHTVDREENETGCLYTQYLYNGTDFQDPVTVIYGRILSKGNTFGTLQKLYSQNGAFEAFSEIVIYIPNKELHYRVFGSTEYSKTHILNEYQGFSDLSQIPVLMDDLYHYHTMSHQFDSSVSVTEDDKLLILSTRFSQDEERRYLLLAKLIEEIS